MPDDDKPQGGDQDGLQKLLDKHKGDSMSLALQLWGELIDYRRKNADLRGKVPTEGSLVLSKEEAADYEKAKGALQTLADLKVKPEELKKTIEDAASENAKLKRDGMLRSLTDAGYSFQVLSDFDALEGAGIQSYAVKDEQKDSKPVKVAYVTVDGKERPFDDYAREKRPALASILRENGQQGGKPFVNQDAGGRAPAGDIYAQIREDAKKRDEAKKAESVPLTERKGLTVIGANA